MSDMSLPPNDKPHDSPRVILCVDDDATVLQALRTLLSKHLGRDQVVEIAESGDEALELLAELQSEGRPLAVLISDFVMPGMKGDELLARCHARSPGTVKIMLTGQSSLDGVKRAINEADLYRFLEKPFNNADLVLTAREADRRFQLEHAQAEVHAELAARIAGLEAEVQAHGAALPEPVAGASLAQRLDQLLAAIRLLPRT